MAPLSVDRFKKSTNETTDEHEQPSRNPKASSQRRIWQMTNGK